MISEKRYAKLVSRLNRTQLTGNTNLGGLDINSRLMKGSQRDECERIHSAISTNHSSTPDLDVAMTFNTSQRVEYRLRLIGICRDIGVALIRLERANLAKNGSLKDFRCGSGSPAIAG